MKSTGIVRKVDDLGRIVLPKELRKVLDIDERDPLEIYVDGNFIMLQKYEPSCIFCGRADGITSFKGKNICSGCIEAMKKAVPGAEE
ncbi:MAG: AbrB/MazE/SpoVT family DNA-binding domain-containing protein [Oscillospiraceae bacterium]|nr:AbrB/MazE/SpoVT family DNA-binding domain-containing protein [Oscillospiraceae bacterium]